MLTRCAVGSCAFQALDDVVEYMESVKKVFEKISERMEALGINEESIQKLLKVFDK